MTQPTDELGRLLTDAADDIVRRRRDSAPRTPLLWRRGRRATWLVRGAAAGLAVALVLLGGTLVGVVRATPATVPADGSAATYPQLVSDLFTRDDAAAPGPVFGLVALPSVEGTGSDLGVLDRGGALTAPPRWSASTATVDLHSLGNPVGALAPDGVQLLVRDGILDMTDGSLARPLMVEGVSQVAIGSRAVWSPSSEYVAFGGIDGPTVIDRRADVVLAPAGGDTGVLVAGWRDDTTLLGLRTTSGTAGSAFDIVTRRVGDPGWRTLSTVGTDAVAVRDATGQVTPSAVFASPDGSRLLIVDSGVHSMLVDTLTGQRVAFAGATLAAVDVAWDGCDPVWLGDQPLRASGGLHRPADGRAILAFSDRVEARCVSLAGNELTGTPAPGRAAVEQVWRVALPVFWVLLVAGALWVTAWSVTALRRSRRHGEDFLPIVLGRLF